MGADFVYDSETPSVIITHRKVRRSRCMCLLFLFLIAIFVGLVPIMVYRSLGVPLPRGLRNATLGDHLNQVDEPPTLLDGADDIQVPSSAQRQDSETNKSITKASFSST